MKNLLFLFAPQMESYNSNGAMNGDGSSNAPISDNREGVTNVINPNVPENEGGEVRDSEVDRRNFIYQEVVERAISELEEHARAGFRAIPPLLNINLHVYEAANSTCSEPKEKCSVCLEEFCDKEELARIDCGHMYHMDCLKKWNLVVNTCPICRRRVAVICHFTLKIRAYLDRLAAANQLSSGSVN
ncbi:probable E3 ubiquitin-protein ligase HIP1 [Solanum pennellii]|uniref:RING-type E3 ubiquitin transferase n=1 Tax=Solanum pennellii TaxID=28526 RepID=A0ABM1HMG9_SOLPN|nr:probable E3 ubiquitin-protein ligase HIP1 [Solanum pennellii]